MRRALILTLVIMLIGSYMSLAATAELPSWMPALTAPTSGGYGEAVVGNGQDIFLLKCLYATSTPELYRYSETSGTWSSENTAPLLAGMFRNGTALAWNPAEGGTIYALGGGRYADPSRTVFLQYQVENSTWSTLPDTPFSQGAGDALAWCGYDSSLYALVGSARHNGGRSYFLRYDPVASTWSQLPFLWSSTDDGAALAWTGGEYLYALAGEYDETLPNGDFARFNIPSQTWERLPPLPAAGGVGDGGSLLWFGDQLAQYQDYIFALSGGTVSEAPGDGFYRYSTSLGEWESLEDIPCPVGYYVGNRLGYAAGGLYYWQGSPKSDKWVCEGTGFYQIPLSSSDPQPRTCLDKLNSATYADFDAVSDIGPVLAQRLVDAQPFASIYDLDNVSQIGPVRMGSILDYFCPDRQGELGTGAARLITLETQVRKLSNTIDDLKDRIQDLEDEVGELQSRVEELEEQVEALSD